MTTQISRMCPIQSEFFQRVKLNYEFTMRTNEMTKGMNTRLIMIPLLQPVIREEIPPRVTGSLTLSSPEIMNLSQTPI